MTESHQAPIVSEGIPVYSGERHVAQVIEPILDQAYEKFELIISDNTSMDSTEEICRGYVQLDLQIQYHCQSANLGAVGKFSRMFESTERCWLAPSSFPISDCFSTASTTAMSHLLSVFVGARRCRTSLSGICPMSAGEIC